jgi:hypothetical protein
MTSPTRRNAFRDTLYRVLGVQVIALVVLWLLQSLYTP